LMWFANKPLSAYEGYLGEIYNSWFTKYTLQISNFLARVFDVRVVDGFVNGVADFFLNLAQVIRVSETGLVRNYAFTMLLGSIVIIAYYLFAC